MLCPFCREKDTSVIDSRATEDGTAIRRRRLSSCCNQRFTTFERVQFVSKIYRNLEDLGQNEIMTSTIGKFVMDGLKEIDPVGYVRFASVYTNFKEAKDFENFVDNIDAYRKK